MVNEFKQRFIDRLEEEAAQAHKAAQAWRELEKHSAQLEDGHGKIIATAAEMAKKDEDKEEWLRGIIAKTEGS
jgi:uncharacterized protein (DUF3084 family)